MTMKCVGKEDFSASVHSSELYNYILGGFKFTT